MPKPNIHPLLAFTGDFLNLLQDHPRVDVAYLRALADNVGRWGGTIIEIEAWRRDPTGVDQQTLSDLVSRVGALFEAARTNWPLLQVSCLAAGGLLRAAAKAGFETDALANRFERDLLDIIAKESDAHAFGARLSRFLLLEGIYDAAVSATDQKSILDPNDRRREAESMLLLITTRLDPAGDERKAALEMYNSPDAAKECARIDIAETHRRLSWETSLAAEKYGQKMDHPDRWLALAARYRNDGDDTNAIGALSNGLERFVEVWERTKKVELLASMHELAAPLVDAAATLAPEMTLEIRKVLARAELARAQSSTAADLVEHAVTTIKELLAGAGDDEFRRSYLLRDADDWIGLAAAANVDVALGVRTILRPVFPDQLQLIPIGDTQFIYPILGRQRAGIVHHNGDRLRFVECAAAHDVARKIYELHGHARRDINDYRKGTADESRWRDLLSQLAGMLRICDLQDQIDAHHVVMLLEGTSVHVPWPALFIATGTRCKSVELRLLQHQTAAMVDAAKGALVLNAFKMKPSPEQWRQAIEEVSTQVGANPIGPSVAKDEKVALVLLGAHGCRRAFGDLSLVVGDSGTEVAAVDFVAQAPIGRTTFCGVCYAGGGFLSGTGEWQSLPSLLLSRGGERVLANLWPAWDLPTKRRELAELLGRLRDAPERRDAAEAVMEWQQGAGKDHPRWWSGWGLWTVQRA